MRKVRISKRRDTARRGLGGLEPLPLDPRDRDIMRAKRLARLRPSVRR